MLAVRLGQLTARDFYPMRLASLPGRTETLILMSYKIDETPGPEELKCPALGTEAVWRMLPNISGKLTEDFVAACDERECQYLPDANALRMYINEQ